MRLQPIKGKMPILMGLLALVMAGMFCLYRCSHSSSGVENIYSHPRGDTLSVAIEMSPLCYTYSGDSVKGFDYELIKEICAIHNVPVVFHPFTPLDYAFKGMESGKFDMVVASLPATEELRKKYPLTDDVYLDRQVLVQKNDTLSEAYVKSQTDLIGDTVWMAHNSPYITRLRNMSKELGDSVYVMTDPDYSAEHLCILTAMGNIPRAVVSRNVAEKMAGKYPGLDYTMPISFNQFQTWAVNPKYPQLLDSLNSWLGSFKKTEAYSRLAEKYL